MRCNQCEALIDQGEQKEHNGRVLCEDCYMDALSPAKACDPWAVHSARMLEAHGGGAGLTPLQSEILRILEETGGLEPPALLARLSKELTMPQLEREFAALRHMEKARGERREGKVYLRVW